MRLVSNSSPLIFLAQLDALDLLERYRIIIPFQVKQEILYKETIEKEKLLHFLNKKNVAVVKIRKKPTFSTVLGVGEMGVIQISLEKNISSILIDDKRAWALAKLYNLKPKGTIWIIFQALKNGVISLKRAQQLLYDLPSKGFYLDEKLLMQVLKKIHSVIK